MAERINWQSFTGQAVHGNPPAVGGIEWHRIPEIARTVWNHPFATRIRENAIPDLIVGGVTGGAARVVLAGSGGWMAGAIGGAAAGIAVEAFREVRTHQQIDGRQIGIAALRGAIGGVIGFGVADFILSRFDVSSLLTAIQERLPGAVEKLPSTPYRFQDPDKLAQTITGTNTPASSANGAAEWEWFKAHVREGFKTDIVGVEVGGIVQNVDIADSNKLDPFNGYHRRIYEMLMEDQTFAVTHNHEVAAWVQGLRNLNGDTLRQFGNDFLIPHRSPTGDLLTIQMPTREWFIQEITKIRSRLNLAYLADNLFDLNFDALRRIYSSIYQYA